MISRIRQSLGKDEGGYSLAEMMTVILLLTLILGSFYSFLFGGERAVTDGREWLEMNQTARLAFERISRELREADRIRRVGTDPSKEIEFEADFDAGGSFTDGVYSPEIDDDEIVTYLFQPAQKRIVVYTVATPYDPVDPTILAGNISSFSLSYYGSEPRADCANGDPPTFGATCLAAPGLPDPDGIITWQELDKSVFYGIAGFGDNSGTFGVTEFPHITSIVIRMTVEIGDLRHTYRTAVELRNTFR